MNWANLRVLAENDQTGLKIDVICLISYKMLDTDALSI